MRVIALRSGILVLVSFFLLPLHGCVENPQIIYWISRFIKQFLHPDVAPTVFMILIFFVVCGAIGNAFSGFSWGTPEPAPKEEGCLDTGCGCLIIIVVLYFLFAPVRAGINEIGKKLGVVKPDKVVEETSRINDAGGFVKKERDIEVQADKPPKVVKNTSRTNDDVNSKNWGPRRELIREDTSSNDEDKITENISEPVKRTYEVGETVNIGHMSYKVIGKWWMPSLGEVKPKSRFLVININVLNNDFNARTIPQFNLRDDISGNGYEISINYVHLSKPLNILHRLEPSKLRSGYILFDVPQEAYYKLVVSGGSSSAEWAYINLR
ncbi:DUF4352 domain-containing protein [Candidatus Riflebacteria bacterium]